MNNTKGDLSTCNDPCQDVTVKEQAERAAFGDALFDYGMTFSTSVEPGEIKAARERVASMFASRVARMPTEEEVIAVAETSWSTISFDEDGHSIYHFEKDYLQRFAKNLFAAAEAKRYASADDLDAEIHRLLEMKIERFPEYAKSLLEGYATKVEVFDHMIKVAQAAGFESLTEAIFVAKKTRAALSAYSPVNDEGFIPRPDLERDPLWQWRCIANEAEIVANHKGKFLMLSEEMCIRLGAALEDAATHRKANDRI